MDFILNSSLFAAGLLAAMLACMEIGFRIGRGGDAALGGKETVLIEGAIFALLGLLVAFTFSGAAGRIDQRRALIVDEANAVGTAYLRLSLLPAQVREHLQTRFRRYVDGRLAAYRALPDIDAAGQHITVVERIQREIWTIAVDATRDDQAARLLLLPAINDMFDIAAKRTAAARMHPSPIVFGLLFGLALLSSLLAGRATAAHGGRPVLHAVVYALAMTAAVYVIVDMEFPRFGLIRVDAFDSLLLDARKAMD